MEEKTQKPTPKRLRDARKRGEVVFSSDVSSTASFVGVVVAMWALGGGMIALLNELWRHATSSELMTRPSGHFVEILRHSGVALLWGALSITAVAALAAIAGSFFQVGGIAAWERLKPDVNRMNPGEGLKRIFSTRNLVNFLKMLLKTGLLAVLMFVVVRGFLDASLKLGYGTPSQILVASGRALLVVFGWAAVIYALVAAIDYTHEYFEFMKQQRMSIEEVRKEYRETEGDPINQSRRRSAHFEAVYMGLGDRVRTASAVICSASTAVALQYRGEKDLPRVVARGENEVAAQIRRFASEAMIPMEFDPGLAGRVYDEVPLDQPIPRSLYAPIATLLRWATGAA